MWEACNTRALCTSRRRQGASGGARLPLLLSSCCGSFPPPLSDTRVALTAVPASGAHVPCTSVVQLRLPPARRRTAQRSDPGDAPRSPRLHRVTGGHRHAVAAAHVPVRPGGARHLPGRLPRRRVRHAAPLRRLHAQLWHAGRRRARRRAGGRRRRQSRPDAHGTWSGASRAPPTSTRGVPSFAAAVLATARTHAGAFRAPSDTVLPRSLE